MNVAKPLLVLIITLGVLFYISRSMRPNDVNIDCQSELSNHYQEVLNEAFADESLWRLGGYDSAQDYAKSRTAVYLEGLKKYKVCR